ncbi:diguanylate cyclase [Aliikangiella coralliicola]|uniref:diguanylate cyclase n=1 Tax=Aliikangiella coralliicola TaxID=2592383 RepID=A0A545UJZ6_9GAMM|nr:diguanylate cyclase [Aliikangiella coralliicola]TQV89779.1 GGDEF domain-containing protein [Aliikangiella coralliicola]
MLVVWSPKISFANKKVRHSISCLRLTIALCFVCHFTYAMAAPHKNSEIENSLGTNPVAVYKELALKIKQVSSNHEKLELLYQMILARAEIGKLDIEDELNESIILAQQLGDDYKRCLLQIFHYKILSSKTDIDQEFNAKNLAETCSGELNDPNLQVDFAWVEGGIAQNRGSITQAINSYNKAYEISKKNQLLRKTFISLIYLSRASAYTNSLVPAGEYLDEAETLFKQRPMLHDSGILEYTKGSYYLASNKLALAQEHTLNTIKIGQKYNNEYGLISAYFQLAQIASQQHKIKETFDNLELAQEIALRHADNNWLVELFTFQAQLGLQTHELDRVSTLIAKTKEILKTKDNPLINSRLAAIESRYFAATQNYEQAYRLQQKSIQLQYKAFKNQNDRNLKEMAYRFNFEHQQTENALLQEQNRAQQLELEKQQSKQRLHLLVGVLLILLLLFSIHAYRRETRIKKQMTKLALTDELTGASNRRHIFETLTNEIERAKRYQFPLTISVIDLDHFKKVNDSYGHHVGDKVLKHFAETCQQHLRSDDNFGRIGGEEWLFIFPHTDPEKSLQVCNRIKKSLAETIVNPMAQSVTISLGVTALQINDDIESIIHRADLALYQAKNSGRDRAIVR